MKISVYIAVSANGFISNSRNVPDWLSAAYVAGFTDICLRLKAVVMGRTTYDILAPDQLPLSDEGISLVLTSATDTEPANETVVFHDGDAQSAVSLLQDRGVDEAVIIGGTTVISDFVRAGRVSDVIMIMEPALFGSGGLPLLRGVDHDVKLTLIDVARLNPNTVRLHYRTARD